SIQPPAYLYDLEDGTLGPRKLEGSKKPEAAIDGDVVLVAEGRNGEGDGGQGDRAHLCISMQPSCPDSASLALPLSPFRKEGHWLQRCDKSRQGMLLASNDEVAVNDVDLTLFTQPLDGSGNGDAGRAGHGRNLFVCKPCDEGAP